MMATAQEAFAAALRDPAAPLPSQLAAPSGGASLADRFAVYRANHAVSLREALAEQFPVCRRLVGEEFFDAVADAYLREEPPREAALQRYGDRFADFIAAFPPCAPLEYLADVAALEFAWREAWGAADANPLRIGALGSDAMRELLDTQLRAHPALRRLQSVHPVASIWRAHQGDGPVQAPADWQPEAVLLCRPDADVTVDVLEPAEAALLDQLLSGATLAQAAEALDPTADCATLFHALARRGAFLPPHPEP